MFQDESRRALSKTCVFKTSAVLFQDMSAGSPLGIPRDSLGIPSDFLGIPKDSLGIPRDFLRIS